jgi:hypothetical protein
MMLLLKITGRYYSTTRLRAPFQKKRKRDAAAAASVTTRAVRIARGRA